MYMTKKEPLLASTRAACYMILIKHNKVCLILRSNTGYRDGEWALPSGKVDLDETFSQSAVRELSEEVGVTTQVLNIEHAITSHRKSDNESGVAWADVYFVCKSWKGEPYNAEPHKHEELRWFDVDDLPDSLMDYQRKALEAWRIGNKYIEIGWETK